MNKAIVTVLTAAALSACAGFGRGDAPRARLLERIPNDRPSWVGWEEATREKGGRVFIVASARQGGDYALTLAQAEAEGAAILARRVGEELSHRLRATVSGPNRNGEEAGRFIERVVQEQTAAFRVSGVDVRARYCERWWEGSSAGSREYYNCWAQLAVDKADVAAARRGLARQAAAAVSRRGDEEARMAAEAFAAELGATRGAE